MTDTIQSKANLKSFFETSDIPTQSEFDDTITSLGHVNEPFSFTGSIYTNIATETFGAEVDNASSNITNLIVYTTAGDGFYDLSAHVVRSYNEQNLSNAVYTIKQSFIKSNGTVTINGPRTIQALHSSWENGVQPLASLFDYDISGDDIRLRLTEGLPYDNPQHWGITLTVSKALGETPDTPNTNLSIIDLSGTALHNFSANNIISSGDGNLAVSLDDRKLYANDGGTTNLDWATPNKLSLTGSAGYSDPYLEVGNPEFSLAFGESILIGGQTNWAFGTTFDADASGQTIALVDDLGGGGEAVQASWGFTKNLNRVDFTSSASGFTFNLPILDITGPDPIKSIDPNNRLLFANDGTTSVIDWSDPDNIATYAKIEINGQLDSVSLTMIGSIGDNMDQIKSIDPNSREFYDSNGNIVASYASNAIGFTFESPITTWIGPYGDGVIQLLNNGYDSSYYNISLPICDSNSSPSIDTNNRYLAGDNSVGTILGWSNGVSLLTASVNASYSVTGGIVCVICDSVSDFTVTLPIASSTKRLLKVKNVSTGIITIDGDGSDTIDGVANVSLGQWDSVDVLDYGASTWAIL